MARQGMKGTWFSPGLEPKTKERARTALQLETKGHGNTFNRHKFRSFIRSIPRGPGTSILYSLGPDGLTFPEWVLSGVVLSRINDWAPWDASNTGRLPLDRPASWCLLLTATVLGPSTPVGVDCVFGVLGGVFVGLLDL